MSPCKRISSIRASACSTVISRASAKASGSSLPLEATNSKALSYSSDFSGFPKIAEMPAKSFPEVSDIASKGFSLIALSRSTSFSAISSGMSNSSATS